MGKETPTKFLDVVNSGVTMAIHPNSRENIITIVCSKDHRYKEYIIPKYIVKMNTNDNYQSLENDLADEILNDFKPKENGDNMVTIDLRDPHLIEHLQAIQTLQKIGIADANIQQVYDERLKRSKEDNNETT